MQLSSGNGTPIRCRQEAHGEASSVRSVEASVEGRMAITDTSALKISDYSWRQTFRAERSRISARIG